MAVRLKKGVNGGVGFWQLLYGSGRSFWMNTLMVFERKGWRTETGIERGWQRDKNSEFRGEAGMRVRKTVAPFGATVGIIF